MIIQKFRPIYEEMLEISLAKSITTFEFNGRVYSYLYHPYNETALNERSVEIPIFADLVSRYSSERILEIGNVLSHYVSLTHTVVDKYERANGVINEDVVNFKSRQKYDLIISISTLEHVGYDEREKDREKVLRAIGNLRNHLTPQGECWISMPLGYNKSIARLVLNRKIDFDAKWLLRRVSFDNSWAELPWDIQAIAGARYLWDSRADRIGPFCGTNVLLIGKFNGMQ